MSEFSSWNNTENLAFDTQSQYLHDVGLSGPGQSDHAEDHLEAVPLTYPHGRSEDDPWNPMKVNRGHIQYNTAVESSGAIPQHYPTDVLSEPDLLDVHSNVTLPPINTYLSGGGTNTHKHIHNRTIRSYRAPSFSESVRTEPSSWITINTDADAISAFSERAETVLSGGSTTGGRSGGVSVAGQWRCDDCDKTFTSRGGLSKHKKVGAHGQRQHRCQRCGASFDMSKDLNRHIATRHKTEGNSLFCHVTTCNRSFGKGKGFSRYDNLRQHVKNRHGKGEWENMPKGGYRMPGVNAHSTNRNEDLLSLTTPSQAEDQSMDTSQDVSESHTYEQDDMKEDDDQNDEDMQEEDDVDDIVEVQDQSEYDAEGDVTIPDGDSSAVGEDKGKGKDLASYQSMPPPPIPSKSKSPEKSQKRISWAPDPETVPPSRIIWPCLNDDIDGQSGGVSMAHSSTLEVTEDGSLSPRTVQISSIAASVDIENQLSVSSPASQQASDEVIFNEAKTMIRKGLNKAETMNSFSSRFEELRNWLVEELRSMSIKQHGDAQSEPIVRGHGVPVTQVGVSDNRDASTGLNFMLHPHAPSSTSGHSRTSSMPNIPVSSYASSALNVFSMTDGSTSPLTSVRDLFDASGTIVQQNDTAIAQEVMMDSGLVPPLATMMDGNINPLMANSVFNTAVSNSNNQQQQQVKRTCFCGKSFTKVSEYNKHYKRHWKRFLCPFPGCLQRFGTKDDWRRHDSRCHYQLGFYKCLFGGHRTCRAAFTKELFDAHLDSIHWQHSPSVSPLEVPHPQPPALVNTSPEEISRQKEILSDPERRSKFYKRAHNGQNNCEDNFWCGFCRKMIKIDDADFGLKAMNTRVDHIANHFATETPAGALFDEGAPIGSIIPPLPGLPTGLPAAGGSGGVSLAASGGTDGPGGVPAPAGPKWMHYDDYDMRETGPYVEDDNNLTVAAPNRNNAQPAEARAEEAR